MGYDDDDFAGEAQRTADDVREVYERIAKDAAERKKRRREEEHPWVSIAKLREPLPPVPWVCESLRIAPGAVTCFAGFGYSGKTVAAQSLVLSVVSGTKAFGVYSVTRGKGAHSDYEQGYRLSAERYQRLSVGQAVDLGELRDGDLRFVPLPMVYLDDAKAFDWYMKLADGCSILVVDSVRAALPTVEENDSKVRVHLDMLARVSERTSCAVTVIHHAKKDQAGGSTDKRQSLRGSSALFDACQTVWHVQGEEGQPSVWSLVKDRLMGSSDVRFGLRWEDLDGRRGLYPVHLEPEQLEEGAADTSAYLKLVGRILAAVRAGADSKNAVFRAGVYGNRNKLFKVIDELLEDGKLSNVDGKLRA